MRKIWFLICVLAATYTFVGSKRPEVVAEPKHAASGGEDSGA